MAPPEGSPAHSRVAAAGLPGPHGRLVARVQFRRRIRALAGNRTQVLALGVTGLVGLAGVALTGVVVHSLGERLAAGEFVPPATPLRGAVGVGWVALVGLVAVRAVGKTGRVDRPAGVLVATAHRDVVAGVVLAETAVVLAWVGPPAVGLLGAFSLGAGTPLPAVAGLLAVLAAVASAVPAGYCLGLAVRHVLTRVGPIARHRTAVGLLAGAVYFGAILTGQFGRVAAALAGPLARSPVGWLADVWLAVLPGGGSYALAGTALAATALGGAVSLALATRAAGLHWFSDPPAPGDDRPAGADSTDRDRTPVGGLVPAALGRPTGVVAGAAVRRTARAPFRLVYLLYPLFGLAGILGDVVRTGRVPAFLPRLTLLYAAWGAGAAATLNPVGDQGSTLPAALSSPARGRALVGGRLLVGTALGVPLSAVLVAGVGLASPLPVAEVALLAGGSLVAVPAATALASGIGVAFPRFGEVQVTRNRTAVVPSKAAFVVYSLVLVGGVVAWAVALDPGYRSAGALLASGLLSLSFPFGVRVDPGTLGAAGTTVGVLWVLAPIASVRYAVRALDDYRL